MVCPLICRLFGTELELRGKENIKKNGAVVVINHQELIDFGGS